MEERRKRMRERMEDKGQERWGRGEERDREGREKWGT